MSYNPSAKQAMEDEANHQLAYGSNAPMDSPMEETEIVKLDRIDRALILDGDVSGLKADCGILLSQPNDTVFVQFASNRANHVATSLENEADSLGMMSIKYDEKNGRAIMVSSKEETDIVSRVTLSEIENSTGMDLNVNFLNIRPAGNSLYANGSQTLSTIIKKNPDPSAKVVIYDADLSDDIGEFVSMFPSSTAKNVASDVHFDKKGIFANVAVDSPIMFFYKAHMVDGVHVNPHPDTLRQEMNFGRMHVQMAAKTATLYLKKTQSIIDNIIAHSDVCSSRFTVQVKQLQRTSASQSTPATGRFSCNVSIEYYDTTVYAD